MTPRSVCVVLALALLASGPAVAQPAAETPPPASPLESAAPVPVPAPVAVQSLAVLDLFSQGEHPGLGADLWRGASADLARTVFPILTDRVLSPAMAALARRALSTGATGPQDAGSDPVLAATRAGALLAQGDAARADAFLDHARGLSGSSALSQFAAEAALITSHEDKACALGDALTTGRGEVYWLRLRAFCQARAGQADAARLTLDLAEAQARDAVFRRLMTVLIAGAGDPGEASLRGGLDLALSRRLGLDLAAATPKAPASVRLALQPPGPPVPAAQMGVADPQLRALVDPGLATDPVPRRIQAAAAVYAALGGVLTPDQKARLAGFDLGRSAVPPARLLTLQLAAAGQVKADVVLLSLWIAADAGPAGPGLADRVQIVRALAAVGLSDDARAVAAEGLAALPATQ